MPTSTTCGPSSARRAASSRRSGGLAIASPMADRRGPSAQPETPGGSEDRVDRVARQGDARLVRGVGWRLVLFSGGTTLLILLVLGALLYVRVTSSLESTGIVQLDARADSLKA